MTQEQYGAIFSKRVRELRQEQNLTIEQFANIVGISKSSVGYYESQNRVPDIVVAGRMAEALNVTKNLANSDKLADLLFRGITPMKSEVGKVY